MKKKLIIIMAVLILSVAFTGCGGVKEEDIIGTWEPAYYEREDGSREVNHNDLNQHITFKKDGTAESVFDGYYRVVYKYTWKISGSNKIIVTDEDGETTEYCKYIDGELVFTLYGANGPSGNKGIFVKK